MRAGSLVKVASGKRCFEAVGQSARSRFNDAQTVSTTKNHPFEWCLRLHQILAQEMALFNS